MRRERRSQAEAKQSQREAAKLAEEGAKARDHHDELVFRTKKSTREADTLYPDFRQGCRASRGPVLTRIEAVPVHAT
jgi:hypothetical protein